jgi:radical SAM superfamily enzyme YgiQ (UPF0313 family)
MYMCVCVCVCVPVYMLCVFILTPKTMLPIPHEPTNPIPAIEIVENHEPHPEKSQVCSERQISRLYNDVLGCPFIPKE